MARRQEELHGSAGRVPDQRIGDLEQQQSYQQPPPQQQAPPPRRALRPSRRPCSTSSTSWPRCTSKACLTDDEFSAAKAKLFGT